MTITGSAKIFTIYTSQEVFNGQVTVKFSTDGKFLIIGKLNFAADKISISGRLYADLSKVASGSVVVLFLADVPDQVRLLTVYGKLKMGFRNDSGQEVEFDVVQPSGQTTAQAVPTASVVDPDVRSDINAINGRKTTVTTWNGTTFTDKPYIDVVYSAPSGANLDYRSILDAGTEFNLVIGGRTVAVNGMPVPVLTTTTSDGITVSPLTATADDRQKAGGTEEDALVLAIQREGTTRFRYIITEANFTFPRGQAQIEFIATSYKNADVTLANGDVSTGTGSMASSITISVDGATAVVANPGAGGGIDIRNLSDRNYIDVDFMAPTSPSGLTIDQTSITDLDPEFALSGSGLGSIRLDGSQAPLKLADPAVGTVRYRYWLTGEYAGQGDVTLTYIAGSWSFNSTGTAAGGSVTLIQSGGNTVQSIDVALPALTGFQLDASTVVDLTPEFQLQVTAGDWTVELDASQAPVRVGDTNTFKYYITTNIPASGSATATVSWTFLTDNFAYIPTGQTTGGTVGGSAIALGNLSQTNLRTYIDITYYATKGLSHSLDETTVLDSNPEFALSGSSAAGILIGDSPSNMGSGKFRYYLTATNGEFTPGQVSVDFIADTWKDADDATGTRSLNLAFSQIFTIQGATATVVNPSAGTSIGQDSINGQGYIEVKFRPTVGHVLDSDSIDGDEIVLKNSAGVVIALVGTPQRVGQTDNYRYAFNGQLSEGQYTVEYVSGTWSDDSGVTNLGGKEVFAVQLAKASLANPLNGNVVDREALNGIKYIDVTYTPTNGQTLDLASIMDAGQEFILSGANGENVLVNGTPTQPGTLSGTNTFRYSYNGLLDSGKLTVKFVQGSWKDTGGNNGAESTAAVKIITQASTFFIELSGGIELRAADFLDEPLISLTAKVTLDIDYVRTVFTLDFSGQLKIYKIGTVGASAGRFILDMSGTISKVPQFWGVATLETNFKMFEQYGIFMYGKGTLQINTTGYQKTETLTLAGLGDNGADLKRTFQLAPYTFGLEVVAQLRLRPPGMDSDLFRLNGGFYIKINPERFELFVTAELSFGAGDAQVTYAKVTGFLVIVTGLDGYGNVRPGVTPGVAGVFTMGAGADIGLPNIGEIFSASGSITIMFNTTMQDQNFNIPDSFLPLLKPGDPTVINVFRSAPKLDGTKDPSRAGEVYFSVTIEAQLTIGKFLTLNGFLQIQAAGSGAGAYLKVVGAVGTHIQYLGSLTGELYFAVYIGTAPGTTGVVGRVFLTLASNEIPGVNLNGELLLEINTFESVQTIQTFKVAKDLHGRFNGFERNPDHSLVITDTLISVTKGFKLMLSGDLNIGSGAIVLKGYFEFTITSKELQIIAYASLNLPAIGSVDVEAMLRVNDQGLVTHVMLSLKADFGKNIGLEFSVSALLELNTTGRVQTFVVPNGPTVQVQPGFRIHLEGDVNFLGFAKGSGSVDFLITPTEIKLEFHVSFFIGFLAFKADGLAAVYYGDDPGFAMSLDVSVVADASVFYISASGKLQLNTCKSAKAGIAPGFVLALNGDVKILQVLKFNAGFSVILWHDVATNTDMWKITCDARLDFFGLLTLDGHIMLDSTGNFDLSLRGNVLLGSHSFGLEGMFYFHVMATHTTDAIGNPYYHFLLEGSADVSAYVFGFTLASVGLGFSFEAQGAGTVPIVLTLEVRIKILFFTIKKTARFNVGYLELPKPVYLGGQPGTVISECRSWDTTTGGELVANVGDLRGDFRNIGIDPSSLKGMPDEAITIEQPTGDANKGLILVSGYGRTNTYQNATSVTINSGSGNDYIYIKDNVKLPVFIDGGSGEDVILCYSQGPVTIRGGEGNDYIEYNGANVVYVDGGAGDDIINYKGTTPTIIHGGDGNDTITAGPGSDVIYGEGGDDIISPAGGTDRIYTGTGNDVVRLGFESLGSTIYADNGVGETDFVVMMATDKNDTITMQRGGGTRQIDVIGNGKSLTTFGVENISIDAGAGADNVTIYDLADSGISSISVSMGLRSTVNGTRVEMIDVDGDPATTSDDVRSVVPNLVTSPDGASDLLTIYGNATNDTFILTPENPDPTTSKYQDIRINRVAGMM